MKRKLFLPKEVKWRVKRMIKRRLKKGDYEAIQAAAENISITARHFSDQPDYYIERKDEGMLLFNLKTEKLTVYLEKKYQN